MTETEKKFTEYCKNNSLVKKGILDRLMNQFLEDERKKSSKAKSKTADENAENNNNQ